MLLFAFAAVVSILFWRLLIELRFAACGCRQEMRRVAHVVPSSRHPLLTYAARQCSDSGDEALDSLLRRVGALEATVKKDRTALHHVVTRVLKAEARAATAGGSEGSPRPAAASPGSDASATAAQRHGPPAPPPPAPPAAAVVPDGPTPEAVAAVEARLRSTSDVVNEVAGTVATARGELQRALDVARRPGSDASSGLANPMERAPVSAKHWQRLLQQLAAAEAEVALLRRCGATLDDVEAKSKDQKTTPTDGDETNFPPRTPPKELKLLAVDVDGEPRSLWTRVLVTNLQHTSLAATRQHLGSVGAVVSCVARPEVMSDGSLQRAAVVTFRSAFDAQRAVEMLHESPLRGVRLRLRPFLDSGDPVALATTDGLSSADDRP